MTNLTVAPYVAADFEEIELTGHEASVREEQPVQIWATTHEMAGPAFTIRNPEGVIVYLLGVHDMWEGVGELWGSTSPLTSMYPDILRIGNELFGTLKEAYVRLQAIIDPAFMSGVRLVEHLGFQKEGLLRKYGPRGEDNVMYALVRED